MGQIQRRLSLAAIKAQVECLLSWLHQVGPGNKQHISKHTVLIKDTGLCKEEFSLDMSVIENCERCKKCRLNDKNAG